MLKLLILALLAISIALPEEEWSEVTQPKIPLKGQHEKGTVALLDQSLSRTVKFAVRGSVEEQMAASNLEVRLDAVNPIVDLTKSDDDFLVVFTIYNPTDKDIQISQRDTPLEGMQSNLFVVQNPRGEVMEYRGKDAKRTEQSAASEIKTIKAGESVANRVRLSRRYQLDGDGIYYIRVKQPADKQVRYTDVMSTYTKMMIQGTAAHEKRNAERVEARIADKKKLMMLQDSVGAGISYQGCTSSKQTQLAGWHADASHKIASALACTESSCASLVDTWFGASTTQGNFAMVTQSFQTMSSVKDATTYVCQGSAGPCAGGSTFAYVYPTDTTQKVYMCDFTFNYPDYSEKVQTVIHELSHFNHIGNTNDNAYGEQTCINLAQSNFQAALQTADNTGYFGKYANTCYQHGPSGYVAGIAPTVGCTDRYSNCGSLASNCAGQTSAGPISTVCCRSCSGTPTNDCSGISSGGSSGGGSSPVVTTTAPTAAPAPSTGGSDTATNCAQLIASYGCTACCISSTGGPVSSVCAGSCSNSGSTSTTTTTTTTRRRRTTTTRRRRTTTTRNNSCRYANDRECDEPTYCTTGTDCTDCGNC